MRVAARKFAVALWIGAVVVGVFVYVDLTQKPLFPSGTPPETMRWIAITVGAAYVIIRSGGLAVLGIVIWILGDIRDRLVPPE